MALPYAIVTRACLYDSHSYDVGDELFTHDVADKLVSLGFAAPPDDDAKAAEIRRLEDELAGLSTPSTEDTPEESPPTKTGRKAAPPKE